MSFFGTQLSVEMKNILLNVPPELDQGVCCRKKNEDRKGDKLEIGDKNSEILI